MYDVIIIGGGLAGCSSAITLTKLGHKVLLLERGKFPVHKICGEFLSTEFFSLLENLGLQDVVVESKAASIATALVTSTSGKTWRRELPGHAFGLSRYRLDQSLFSHAANCGAECKVLSAVISVDGTLQSGFTVHTSQQPYEGRLVLGAFGKKSALTKKQPNNVRGGSGFVGFKQHYTGTGPMRSVEVHTFDRGYCGVNSIEDSLVNLCWLASRSLLKEHGNDHEAVMQNVMLQNPMLKERLSGLSAVPKTLCAISGVSLSSNGRFDGDVCLIGDSSQMIAPFCGDGMSMAFRSGQLVSPICSDFLNGKISSGTFKARYTKTWKSEFSQRLVIGKTLQSVVLSRHGADAALNMLTVAPAVGDWLISKTRGPSRLLSELQ